MGRSRVNLLFCLLVQFVKSQTTESQTTEDSVLFPVVLKNTGPLWKILNQIEGHSSNSSKRLEGFSQSPRRNEMIYKPTTVKTKIKPIRIQEFNQATHELFLEIIIDYHWIDERFIINRNMRLPYAKIESSPFWRPAFDFENASITKTTYDKFVYLDYEVSNKIFQLFCLIFLSILTFFFQHDIDHDGFGCIGTCMGHRISHTLRILCLMEFSWFPFDVQTCDFGVHLRK